MIELILIPVSLYVVQFGLTLINLCDGSYRASGYGKRDVLLSLIPLMPLVRRIRKSWKELN